MEELPPSPDRKVTAPLSGRRLLQVTVRLDGVPIENRTAEPGESVLPDYPLPLSARREGTGFVLNEAGERVDVGPGEVAHVRAGRLQADVTPVRRFRLPRWSASDADPTLVALLVSFSLLGAQLSLLLALLTHMYAASGGSNGFEPTPEYIARLLRGDTDGGDQGAIARSEQRPQRGEPIQGFYLQPGSEGPATHIGGGRNVGRERTLGELDGTGAAAWEAYMAMVAGDGADLPAPPMVAPSDEPADATVHGEDDGNDKPISVEVTEGWGFSDWYDTEDAREDAQDIAHQLEYAREILRLDPNDPEGLQIRAYYEYLAMDYTAARKTYERFTKLYPSEPAGWNNLALTYKRAGEYEKEEQLYRIALSLAPDDDAPINNLAVCLAHQGRFEEAQALLKRLETLIPDDPYADLHRAKLYAAWGKKEESYRYLEKSLAAMAKLDTLHNIEYRQDIRLDPAFEQMRGEARFHDLLMRYYGDGAPRWWERLLP